MSIDAVRAAIAAAALLLTGPVSAQATGEETSRLASHRSDTCQEALGSEAIRSMDRHLNEIGVHYEKMFNDVLADAGCTADEIVRSLTERGAVYYDLDEYGSWRAHRLKYKPGPMLLKLIRLGLNVVIVADPDDMFLNSNWEVDL